MAHYIPPDRKLAVRLLELIEVNFKSQRYPSFYGDLLGVSVRRLNRITGFYFKRTVYQLLQERVHQEAVVLLSKTTLSSKEICFELGVCDPSHFSKCFKQVEGRSPREFKRSLVASLPSE